MSGGASVSREVASAKSTGRPARGDWQQRMADIVQTVRDMSRQSDPQELVRLFGRRSQNIIPRDAFIALSRRGLEYPKYRVTRSSRWKENINPWKEKQRLPLFEGGLFAELLYGDQPTIIDQLEVSPDDPAAEYLEGYGSLMAIPNFDQGVALNMVITLCKAPSSFDREAFPELVWTSNLFGLATHNLVLTDQVREAYEVVDRELKMVQAIQRALLPAELPKIPSLELSVWYETSRWAGGDYYDLFALPDGTWGILIADVSGHGTPAAVVMAITHSIAHTYSGPPTPPSRMLDYLNHHLANGYTDNLDAFVTAFYGIFDPNRRTLTYSCAGHPAPRMRRCGDGTILALDGSRKLPLGVSAQEKYDESTLALRPGDQIAFFTDGITETSNRAGSLFGSARLDAALADCSGNASEMIERVRHALADFAQDEATNDDRTLLVAKVV